MDPFPIKIRSCTPPYDEYTTTASHPFEVFGEKFAVTETGIFAVVGQYRATHLETGTAIPGSECEFAADVPAQTERLLTSIGEAKLKAAIAKANELIASGQQPHS